MLLRTLLLSGVCLSLATSSIVAAEPAIDPREQQIRDFEKKWELALNAGDTATVETMIGDEFILIGPGGNAIERTEYLKSIPTIRGGRTVRPKITRIKFYGDNAVAVGEVHVTGPRNGRPSDYTLIWTDVLVHRDGRWQVVNVQASLLNPQWDATVFTDQKQ